MDTLPKELEDIIYGYVHQMKMDVILDQLCQEFSRCDYCHDDKPHRHLSFCKLCSVEFCNECKKDLHDNDGEFCDGCIFEQLTFLEIEKTLERKFTGDELTQVMDLLDTLDEDDKENIFAYVHYLYNTARGIDFGTMMNRLYFFASV